MGLKTTNYEVKAFGLILPEAYALIKEILTDGTNAKSIFHVQQSRDACENSKPLEAVEVNFTFNKDLPLHEQAYVAAKSGIFAGWEDDIPGTEVEIVGGVK